MFAKIWKWVSDRGVSTEHPEENALIRLYNQMSFVSAVVTLAVIISAFVLDYQAFYFAITLASFSIYFFILALNHFQHIYTARFILAWSTPIWIYITHFLLGGFFSQSLIICASASVTYLSFVKHPKQRRAIISSVVLIYIAVIIYVEINGPYLGLQEFPYDEIVALIAAGAWMAAVVKTYNNERESLIISLREKNIKLEQTTDELERFTYIASHDLKSPLRTINSFIGLIERDISRENFEALPERMQFVKSGAQQMNTLVEDILEISTLKNPDDKKKTKVDLNKVLEKVQVNLTEDIKSKNAVVNAGKLPSFYCDEAEFLLLFQNMIQNGIKYNDSEKPVIDISTQKTGNQLLISFKDNGIGIDNEYHEQIFQFFKRLHSSDKYQGTGLGLGLCKKIVNSYGGNIEVDSVTGEGSTFRIKLEMETQSN